MSNGPDIRRKVMAKVRPAAEAAVKGMAAHALRAVGDTAEAASPGSGRVYKRGNASHQASAPGDPWASDTGNARQSMTVDFRGGGDVLTARVGPATAAVDENGDIVANYVHDLEYGTRTVAARPTFRTTAQREKDKIAETGRRVFAREMRK